MLKNILAATESGAAEGGGNSWILILVVGAMFIVMMVMTIIPQKKRQKQMQEMMNNLTVGTKVMTIGRMIGTIQSIDNERNQIMLNVGTIDSPTIITIDKAAIGYVMDKNNTAASSDAMPVSDDSASSEVSEASSVLEETEKKEDDLKI